MLKHLLNKSQIIDKFATHQGDTGSPQVQIALLTDKIFLLSGHVEKFKNDIAARVSLVMMVDQRRKRLKYLQRTSSKAYVEVCEKLGLRVKK